MDAYIFESERLGFREWTLDDLDFFATMNNKDSVMKYFPTKLSRQESEAFLQRIILHFDNHGYGLYATEIKETGELIGFIGFQIATFYARFTPCVEIGWRLDDKFWNKGYATEGAKAALKYGFNYLNLQKVYSFTPKINQGSVKVMEKIGLKYQENFNHPKVKEASELCSHVLYLMLHNEYNNNC